MVQLEFGELRFMLDALFLAEADYLQEGEKSMPY
jgi:hypothetical protein